MVKRDSRKRSKKRSTLPKTRHQVTARRYNKKKHIRKIRHQNNINTSNQYNLKTTNKIIELSDAIRKKHAALKLHRSLEEAHIEKHVLPIVHPLQKLLNVKKEIKEEEEEEKNNEVKNEDEDDNVFLSPSSHKPTSHLRRKTVTHPIIPSSHSSMNRSTNVQFLRDEEVASSTPNAEKEEDEDTAQAVLSRSRASYDAQKHSTVTAEFFEQYHELPRKYMLEMLRSKDNIHDTTYGITYDITLDKWRLGNSLINIKNHDKNLWIGVRKYKGTVGLYELLFKKDPYDYTEEDLSNYASMLIQTSAHKVKCDPKLRNRGCGSRKYMEIIKPAIKKLEKIQSTKGYSESSFFPTPKRTGAGIKSRNYPLMQYNSKPFQYVYFDDVNEIVDRLRLLLASRDAGNTSHQNEINSIIEELKELHVIA